MHSAPLQGRKLAQVAIVVQDISLACQRWADVLGVEVPEIIATAPGSEAHADYRGAPTEARAKLAFFDLGGVQLELIEPIGEDSAWYEGLDKRGEGVHHLAFWVDDVGSCTEAFQEKGVERIQRGDFTGGQYAYYDGQEKLGTMLELLASR